MKYIFYLLMYICRYVNFLSVFFLGKKIDIACDNWKKVLIMAFLVILAPSVQIPIVPIITGAIREHNANHNSNHNAFRYWGLWEPPLFLHWFTLFLFAFFYIKHVIFGLLIMMSS